jgi:hypothetical protein
MTRHPLYQAALDADETYSQLLAKHGMTRWTGKIAPPKEVKQAYVNKVNADAAWLDCLRADSLARSARRS